MLEIPSDWHETAQGDFLVIQPTQPLGVASLTATRQMIPNTSTMAEAVEGLKKSAGLTVLSASEITLAGKMATRVVGSNGEGENTPAETLTYILPADATVLIYVRCTVTDPAKFAEYEKHFDAIMQTIALTP
jgi:hypothetical protein